MDSKTTGFSVNMWGSHPDKGNDDCWTGWDFATEAEARERFEYQKNHADLDSPYVELMCGVKVLEIARTNAPLTRPVDDGGEWRREMAMGAGMLHGIDAYNDVLFGGYEPIMAEGQE